MRLIDELGEEPLVAVASTPELEQVFLNLTLNALDAMPGGGVLALVREGETQSADGRPAIAVAVVDTGPGIPREHRERVFEPFYTTKPEGKGSGLGLSVCDGLVRAHGGAIEARIGRRNEDGGPVASRGGRHRGGVPWLECGCSSSTTSPICSTSAGTSCRG